MMRFGDNLRKFRMSLGITQEELAQKISISAQAVSKWERGESMPDAATLPVIADMLNVSLDRLFDRKTESMRDLAHHIHAFINSGDNNNTRNVRRITHLASVMTTSLTGDLDAGRWDAEGCLHPILVSNDDGYVLGNNDPRLPFLCVFEEPKSGWKSALADPDACRRILSVLSAPGVIEAICKLSEHDYISFDETFAGDKLGIDTDTMAQLRSLGLLRMSELEINGVPTALYHARPCPNLIALLIIISFINNGDEHFDFESSHRDAPLLR